MLAFGLEENRAQNHRPAPQFLGVHPKGAENRCSNKRIVHLHSLQPKVETTQVSVRDEQLNEMWPVHTGGCDSAVHRNGARTHAPTRASLADTMLSEGARHKATRVRSQ